MQLSELTHYLDLFLHIDEYEDRSNNGLQVQGQSEVICVAFAVDACLASFQASIQAGAQLLIVHHGLFWSQPMQITGVHYQRLRTLLRADCGLYAVHIPLDAHPEVGNNTQLARLAGLQNITPWGNHHSDVIGYSGELAQPLPLDEFNRRLEGAIGTGNRVQSSGRPVHRVAVLSGFGVDFISQAAEAGADTLLTGETSHTWHHMVDEHHLNVIYGGHYNTETVGLKALSKKLSEQFSLNTVFIDLPTGL